MYASHRDLLFARTSRSERRFFSFHANGIVTDVPGRVPSFRLHTLFSCFSCF